MLTELGDDDFITYTICPDKVDAYQAMVTYHEVLAAKLESVKLDSKK